MAKKAMPKPAATLVDQLRAAIRDSGLTVYRLAKNSGVSQPVIDRFLTGERDIRLETAAKLATALNLELRSR